MKAMSTTTSAGRATAGVAFAGRSVAAVGRAASLALLAFWSLIPITEAQAQETVCARVKIEIKQELTLERQAFDAEMKINNTTDSGVIENVSVVVKVTDENGTPVAITDNSNDTSAKFFIRLSNKQNISDVDGTGTVNPKTTSVINWLLIPAPGSAGNSPLGKKYLVGATLKYRFGGEDTVLEISPDVITVKPLPLLTLDYFLQQDVIGDDPLTSEIEAVEPATLGVRVRNNGFAIAKNLKIDSAQPKIVENNQGLLINFTLTGSYVDDAPTQNTLLINFGDIAPSTSKMGRWLLETTLAGKFTEFTAKFSHADELGGSLTSLIQATNAHLLIRDVRVDLPGRDAVRDFLAQDGDVIRIYESDGPDTLVTDRSGVAQMTADTNTPGNANYRITFPPTAGFAYMKLRDPFNGTKAFGQVQRSDAKQMLPENVWLSKTRNLQTKVWEYWVNVFDVNSTGIYDTGFKTPPASATPPQLQFIPDRTVREEQQVSFLVEASSASGGAVTINAAPLPAGARLLPQAADPQAPGLTRALFDWTPPRGSAGSYLITYTASDGQLSGSRSASIRVESTSPPPGPGTPTIAAPASGGQVTSLRPTLGVQMSSSAQDTGTQVQFEVYSNEAMTQLVESATVAKAAAGAGSSAPPTTWQPTRPLNDNTTYWWRARAFDGLQTYSIWANSHFRVNQFNDPPDSFNLTSPAPAAEVAELQPVLAWTNAVDKDGDAISYGVTLYSDAALSDVLSSVSGLSAGTGGSTSWTVPGSLTNHARYYWRVVATDALGAQTAGISRFFVVNTGNTAPSAPALVSPAVGGQSTSAGTTLTVRNSADAENDLLTYVFEIDSVSTFDSGDKRSSGQVIQSAGQVTTWTATGLVENRHYHWRVKAQDGRAESAWVGGDFLMNAVNDAPPMPSVKNPGNAAWSSTLQPSLEANPVQDPEEGAVRYQFEVYRDASLSNRVADGVSDNTAWIVPVALTDKTTHWWRVRALDAQSLASPWSPATVLYVSTGPYQDPSIQVTAPATPLMPELVETPAGPRKQVTIRWEGTDPNIEPTVALYYGNSRTGFTGNVIVDNLRQNAGALAGSYVWDVTDLAPGAYYVYGMVYDSRGVGQAYAPGAVVIPPPTQTGQIAVVSNSSGSQGPVVSVRLGSVPVADVVVPVSLTNSRGRLAQPASLTFTPQNWSVDQQVSVAGQGDCVPDGSTTHQLLFGRAVSTDPNYMGLSGAPVDVPNLNNNGSQATTNNAQLHVCTLTVVTARRLEEPVCEFTLTAEMTNTGNNVSGVTAKLNRVPSGLSVLDDELIFLAINAGEVAKSVDTVTLRSPSAVQAIVFQLGTGFGWNVTVRP